jgi:hypothetical protein
MATGTYKIEKVMPILPGDSVEFVNLAGPIIGIAFDRVRLGIYIPLWRPVADGVTAKIWGDFTCKMDGLSQNITIGSSSDPKEMTNITPNCLHYDYDHPSNVWTANSVVTICNNGGVGGIIFS